MSILHLIWVRGRVASLLMGKPGQMTRVNPRNCFTNDQGESCWSPEIII